MEEWFESLEAPSKERIVFEHSGHRPTFEEPGLFAELMERVRDETYDSE
jgi:pimeloyl-ACP methyl ester carboxylesterase